LAFESIIENSNFFFEAMIFLFPVSHNLDVQFYVAFFCSRGVCFMRFFLSKSYSWVTYERLGFLGLERHQRKTTIDLSKKQMKDFFKERLAFFSS